MNPVVVTKLIDHHRPCKYDLTVSVSIAAAAPAATRTITSVPVSAGHTHDRLTRIRGRPTMSVGAFRSSGRCHFDKLPNVHRAQPLKLTANLQPPQCRYSGSGRNLIRQANTEIPSQTPV